MKITKYLRVINSNKFSKQRFSQFLNKYYGAYMRGGYNKKMKFEKFMLTVINNNSKPLENLK